MKTFLIKNKIDLTDIAQGIHLSGVHPGENWVQKRTFHKNWWPQNRSFTKIRDLKNDPKIKNYNVIFQTRSAANEFIRK